MIQNLGAQGTYNLKKKQNLKKVVMMTKFTGFLFLVGVFLVVIVFTAYRNKLNNSSTADNDFRTKAAGEDVSLKPVADFQISKNSRIDCASSKTCQEISIIGDAKYELPGGGKSPFGGYADPSIRKEEGGLLWMTYSWPHLKFHEGKPVPSVDIHLAKSSNGGKNWNFVKKLFTAVKMNNPTKSTQSGYLDYEVANLLPVKQGGTTTWYGVTLNYFVPEKGGMASRPSDSFHIRVYKSDSSENLTNAEHTVLAGGATANEWGASQRLIPKEIGRLDKGNFFWNEPSLYFENGKLYLTMVAFNLRNRSDITRDAVYVFSTDPVGSPNSWKWNYNGRLAGNAEAKLLSAERLTQIDVARSRDGKLLLIATPDVWNKNYNDYNHKGCVALEIASLERPELRRTVSGNLATHAIISDSVVNELGSAACSYDPESETGILFTRRNKTADELTAGLWATQIRP